MEMVEGKIFHLGMENTIRLDYQDTHFQQCKFADSYIIWSKFRNCVFDKCEFDGLDLPKTLFSNCTFRHCTFVKTVFRKTTLDAVRFEACKFIDASFLRTSLLGGAIFHKSKFANVKFDISYSHAIKFAECFFRELHLGIDIDFLEFYDGLSTPREDTISTLPKGWRPVLTRMAH